MAEELKPETERCLSDQLLGVLKEEYDLDAVKEETLRQHYDLADQ